MKLVMSPFFGIDFQLTKGRVIAKLGKQVPYILSYKKFPGLLQAFLYKFIHKKIVPGRVKYIH